MIREGLPEPGERSRLYLLTSVMWLVTIIAYAQVVKCGYISIDDSVYVLENDNIKVGFSLDTLRWALLTRTDGNWFPLTWLSYVLDVTIGGSSPVTYHVSNLLYHLLNSALLLWVLFRMTGQLYRSAIVAALFALHPLHVESVAWVSERKDVLSTFFLLLTMWSYAWYREKKHAGAYLATLLLFACGLMAKPMLVSLPLLLLFLDSWPFQLFSRPLLKRNNVLLLLEKVPFACLSVISSLITYNVQKHKAVVSYTESPLLLNVKNALLSYVLYIYKTLVPVGLAVMYPFETQLSTLLVGAATLLLVVITVMVFKFRESKAYLLMGWCWYVVALLPVIGIVRVGKQALADRYTYIPHIGLFIMLVWGVSEWPYLQRVADKIKKTIIVSVLVVLAAVTWQQVSYWRTSIELLKHTIAVTKNNWLAYSALGFDYISNGELGKAQAMLNTSLTLNPSNVLALYNLGILYNKLGNKQLAMEYFQKTLSVEADYSLAHYQIGMLLLYGGDTAGALGRLEILNELDADLARQLLGQIRVKNG